MAKDVNQCNFTGNLVKDPEIKYMPNGKAVVNFSIGCSDDYKDKSTGKKVDQTNWVRMVAFDNLAEIIGKYLKKGSLIYASGKHTTRKWQDSNGTDHYTTEIVLNDMKMLDSREKPAQAKSGNESSAEAYRAASGGGHEPTGVDDMDDDIPF